MTKTLNAGISAAVAAILALSNASAQAAPYVSHSGFDLSAGGDAQVIKVRRGRGADDGVGHDVGDDKGGRRGGRGRGADDGPGGDQGGRKGGKGRGADDGRGDDRGGHKGRGRDHGPNHT
ncbi:hypothetical protein MU516_12745 [Paracoccus sp. YLB-12]|uniref:Uncharacterized protein n=1 Tax=Paracoccus maritimus TaxID=2933292 RepID=A0ABT2KCQ8_9RHOB|nr:hypothetical protein [Paracoccus sp. YLB-12]MCT4333734.1 hypothetical protein [Paracoccus sp. YLB-12]